MTKRVLMLLILSTYLSPHVPALATQQDGGYSASAQEIDPELKQLIRRLIAITGGQAILRQVMANVIASAKQAGPNVPAELWSELEHEFTNDIDAGKVDDLMIPVYARHLSADDIRQLIAFYESPLGKKLLQVQPALVQDSMKVGQRWGEDVVKRIRENLKRHGYSIPLA